MRNESVWADPQVETTLQWSFLSEPDLMQLAELRSAIDYFDDPVQRRDLASLLEEFEEDGDLAVGQAVVGRDSAGTVVAYAWNHPTLSPDAQASVLLDVGVHPGWRHRRVGRHLVQWSIKRAQMWFDEVRRPNSPPLWVCSLIDEKFTGLGRAAQANGLEPVRWFFDMYRSFGADRLPDPVTPDYITMVPFGEEYSEDVRITHNEAFSTFVGAQPIGRQAWEESLNRPEARLDLSWVALAPRPVAHLGGSEDHGCVVGYALNSVYNEVSDDGQASVARGWTERFGVCPSWRERGIATALILSSIHSFAADGLAGAGIGVDTEHPEGAERMLGACGFTSEDRVVLYGAHFS